MQQNPLFLTAPLTLVLFLITLSYFTMSVKTRVVFKSCAYATLGFLIFLLYVYDLIDMVSLVLGTSFTAISLLISVYTISYASKLGYNRSLEVSMDLFLVLLTVTYTAPTLLLFVIAWTASEILGYIVIRKGEEHSLEGSLTSSRGFLLVSTMTYEISVFTLIAVSIIVVSTNVSLGMLNTPFKVIESLANVPTVAIPLVLIGFVTKTANVPLHFWLPSAHSSAPSPGSAALSGLMVSLGYYGLYRVLNIIVVDDIRRLLAYFFLILGAMTLVYGSLQAINQRDVKRLLAYSTIATNGYVSILFAMYVYSPGDLTLWTLLLGVLMHAAYKTTLFCEAGLLEIVYGTRYIHGIRGIVRTLPVSTIGGLLAVMSLLGTPGTVGFASKLVSVLTSILFTDIDRVFAALAITFLAVYVAVSALIALKYTRVYFGVSPARALNIVTSMPTRSQLPVMVLGLSNLALIAPVLPLLATGVRVALVATTLLALIILTVIYLHFKVAGTGLIHERSAR